MARARKDVRLRGKQKRAISVRVRPRPKGQSASGMALSSRTERRAMNRLAAASARTPAPQRRGPDACALHPAGEAEGGTDGGHRGQPDDGPGGDGARPAPADEDALVESAVTDRPGPEDQEDHARAETPATSAGRPMTPRATNEKTGGAQENDHDGRDRRVHGHGEPLELPVGDAVPDEGIRRRKEHHDGGFDDPGERGDDGVGGEVGLRVGEAGDERGQERALGGHHQPRRLERQPVAQNGAGRRADGRNLSRDFPSSDPK